MSLNVDVNGVSVKAVRKPTGYFYQVDDILKAAGLPQDESKKILDMYLYTGHAVQRCAFGPWCVDAAGFRDYVAHMRLDPGMSVLADKLALCVSVCETWAVSRKVVLWPEAGDGDGLMLNSTLVRAVRDRHGEWCFEILGMLRVSGISEDRLGELIDRYKASEHAITHRYPGMSGWLWLMCLDHYRECVSRWRADVDGKLGSVVWQDDALEKLEAEEDALCRLEECIAECGHWAAVHEDLPVCETDGSQADCCHESTDWAEFVADPFAAPQLAL